MGRATPDIPDGMRGPPRWRLPQRAKRDLFMSLIHSCELNAANPFDYLTELLRHAEELKQSPSEWMPWNDRATLTGGVRPAGRVMMNAASAEKDRLRPWLRDTLEYPNSLSKGNIGQRFWPGA